MKPKIVTSFRPHGKWGDFLAAIVPVLWCLNILANSNFILRLIEWQSETNLFTIRIRARQWYWVYKIDLKNFFSILNVNKSMGRDKWVHSNLESKLNSFKTISIINRKHLNNSSLNFWNELLLKNNNVSKTSFVVNFEKKDKFSLKNSSNILKYNDVFNLENNLLLKLRLNSINVSNSNSFYKLNFNINQNYLLNIKDTFTVNLYKNDYILNNSSFLFDFSESSRHLKNSFGQKLPFRLIKTNFTLNNEGSIFIKKFNNTENSFKNRDLFSSNFLTIKQKKYTKKNNLVNFQNKSLKSSVFLFNNKVFIEAKNELFNYYKLIKKNKNHSDLIASTLNRRLLRTKKTLTIPAHINLSIITSSFDIVHSWFIPGLGLKLDCVPGRSTHHSFYVDNVGFYYGQCAEICGRYHHHMPIRICALPFEHFLIWWQNFGLIKIYNLGLKKKNSNIFYFRKFCW
jgi:heme/copper-type cytochrome/quinol oxidase subunit 2